MGAMSLVTRDCEPWTIYVGSPARPLKPRRRDEIERLDREIRANVYDSNGRYIPRRERGE